MNGWYKQARNLSERTWFKDPLMVQLYSYLKERAYVADGMYEKVRIRRGSCPVTRSEIMEVTGMNYSTLNRKLTSLISYGEIIVRANNHFSVITICDYDSCGNSESLFDTASDIANDTTGDTASDTTGETTHLSTKEGRRKKEDNLISLESYKKERESLDDAYKIKERYNRTFDGKLPPCIRLTVPTKMMALECVRRFGEQSVDIVFEQVLGEPFSMGVNNTGFRASFQFIFNPKNFQGYLERAQLRRRKASAPQPQRAVGVIGDEPRQERDAVEDRKRLLMDLVELCRTNPTTSSRAVLEGAYARGELYELGIDWKPNNI